MIFLKKLRRKPLVEVSGRSNDVSDSNEESDFEEEEDSDVSKLKE